MQDFEKNLFQQASQLEESHQIQITQLPQKFVYDFTKNSSNYKQLQKGIFDEYEYNVWTDSKIHESELFQIEAEIKKKHEKWLKKKKAEEEKRKQELDD